MKLSQEYLLSRVIGRTRSVEVSDPAPSPRGNRVSQSEIRSLFADVFEENGFAQANSATGDTKRAA